MRSSITLLIGISAVFLFLSIYWTPYVNGQSSTLNGSLLDNETSSTNSVSQTENLDPFMLRGSSNNLNTGNNNDPSQANDGSSTDSNNDDTSIANDGSSATSSSDGDGSSTTSSSDESDNDGSDDDNSSEEDKESEDDSEFELPFP